MDRTRLTDIARSVIHDDGICELLVHALVVYETTAFVDDFGLGSIWDCIMQSRPKHLKPRTYMHAVRSQTTQPDLTTNLMAKDIIC